MRRLLSTARSIDSKLLDNDSALTLYFPAMGLIIPAMTLGSSQHQLNIFYKLRNLMSNC